MDEVKQHYARLMSLLGELPDSARRQAMRKLVRTDLYFLMRYVLQRKDMEHPWVLERAREVQEQPDGYLDLWAREHFKSSLQTFGKTIQDIAASHGDDPLPEWNGLEPTFAIFSHTRPNAKKFLRQIKVELETNLTLKDLFPDVFYADPERESPRWSEDNGLLVRRRTNPKEATVEAWGLVDGQPTGSHFDVLIYDDVVTRESVNSPDMISKTTDAWAVSTNLGAGKARKRMLGTRWHHNDTYRTILERGSAVPRIRPATDDGTLTGKPVFLSQEDWEQKVRDQGPYQASAQLLLNPIADSKQTFRREWLRYYDDVPAWNGMNRALLVDPASEKKRTSDYTAIAVIGKGADENYYLLDAVRDRLSLQERAERVIELHRRWKPLRTGYEKYGMQADIEYLKERMARESYRFDIDELGGRLGKTDRVNRLIPVMADGKFWLPDSLWRTNYERKTEDLVRVLIEQEIMAWPVPVHDDLLDAMSRVFDLDFFPWPMSVVEKSSEPRRERYISKRTTSWMAA